MTSVQEYASDNILTMQVAFNRMSAGITEVYWDRVWKTFIVIDKGSPALSGQPVVRGTVRDTGGVPISDAVVKLTQNGADYMAVTDSAGNYTIATPAGLPLSYGSYPIECGDYDYTVSLGSNQSTVNFNNVNTTAARDSRIDGEIYNLN